MRHLHAGKINYNATSMINEDMMMMVMNAHIIYMWDNGQSKEDNYVCKKKKETGQKYNVRICYAGRP